MDESGRAHWYWWPSFAGFAIACAVFWGILWLFMLTLASSPNVHTLAYVFLGWVIGFFVAALGRLVYPAPKSTLMKARARK